MPPISFSLKTSGASTSKAPKAGPPKRLALGEDEGEPSSAAPPRPRPPTQLPPRREEVAAQADALATDPGVYDYDGAYEKMSRARAQLAAQKQAQKQERTPQYMSSFLEKAALRKRDRERAEVKLIQRQREQEGEDTEAFVTDAYRAHLVQIQREEQEQAEAQAREAKEKDASKFRRELLKSQEERHAALQRAVEGIDSDGDPAPATASEQPEEACKLPRDGVERNEDGQVVDERQLLSTGLNVIRSRPASTSKRPMTSHQDRPPVPSHRSRGDRARQSRLVEQQMLELERARAEEAKRERSRAQAVPEDREQRIQAARERALQRKRQRVG